MISAPSLGTLFWVAVTALDVLAIVRALLRGRAVEGTLAWIFAILAMPGIGALLYLALGNPRIARRLSRRQFSRRSARRALRRGLGEPAAELALTAEERSMLQLATQLTQHAPSSGNAVRLMNEDAAAFRRVEAELRAARTSIWAEYYMIRNDQTGHRFLDVLAERARDGIEVRLLYDAFGSLRLDAARLARLRESGGHTASFLPLDLRRRWSVHLRNHRKMVIVDGVVGFTGGMNVGDEYSGRARRRGLHHFRDSHVEIRGPAVAQLSAIFVEDWELATDERLATAKAQTSAQGACVVAVVPSGPDQEENANGLVYFSGLGHARERCYLTSPYFIPDQPTLRALIAAAMSGVDVRVVVPRTSDVWLVGLAGRSFFPRLLRGGVRVFEFEPAMLHAKTMVVDGRWGMVGSANVDMRSFNLNFELGALIFDPTIAGEMERRFMADLARSREVTADDIAGRGFLSRLMEGGARLLSPLL